MSASLPFSDLAHIGVLNRAEVGTRGSGWNGVFPSMRHPKLSQVPALHKLEWWSGGAAIWCASDCRGALNFVGAGTRKMCQLKLEALPADKVAGISE